MANWITRKPYPDEKRREAVQGEFFAAASIQNEAQALVREGIQNSLDAAIADPQYKEIKPRVRIFISGKEGALSWTESQQFFGQAWPHYKAENSGLIRDEFPEDGSVCEYLVFEDFRTSGLTGDISRTTQPDKGDENAFYYYLRAEGQSGKADSDRGRWGIGKFVFPRASKIRTFLALTKRADDNKTLVTGQFILKWHTIDNMDYSPDGWFGEKSPAGTLLPSTEQSLVTNVKTCFNLSRDNEPGLSLIVPWCRSEITRNILIQSVLRDFYYPVLKCQLEVEVADSLGSEIIDEYTFNDIFKSHISGLTSDEAAVISLAQVAATARGNSDFSVGLDPDKNPVWSDDLVLESDKPEIRQLLDDGNLISIRVPVWIHKNVGEPINSEIQVWLMRDETAKAGRPVFIREGLVIPAAHSRLSRGFRSLVLIEHQPIAKLLGDAENPSHTKWDAKSEHFQGKYHTTKGAQTISFVRNVVVNLIDAVTKSSGEKDLTTLANVFKAPRIKEQGKAPRPGKKPVIKKPVTPDTQRAKLWGSTKLKDPSGFAIYHSGAEFDTEKILTIKVGYDVVKGNPINKWSPYDFKFENDQNITITCSGAGLDQSSIQREGNKFSVRITGSDFRIKFHGFDEHRDLFVAPTMKDVI